MRISIADIVLLCVTGALAAPALDLNVLSGRGLFGSHCIQLTRTNFF